MNGRKRRWWKGLDGIPAAARPTPLPRPHTLLALVSLLLENTTHCKRTSPLKMK